MSLDGFIAESDGGYGWVKGEGDSAQDTKSPFDMMKFMDGVDSLVMGRGSWEICTPEALEMFKQKKIYVATHRDIQDKPDNVEIISGNVVRKILDMQKGKGKDMWLFGGTKIIDDFLKAKAIDEYAIAVVPIILGEGKPLFLGKNPMQKLHLKKLSSKDGMVFLEYVKRK